MKFTQIPVETFQQIQLNAGILVDDFDPATGKIGRLMGATTGGINFKDSIEYTDFGEDIDNCPKNMMELKKLDNHAVTMSGTFVTLSADTAKMLVAVGDVDSEDETHIVPRNELLMADFVQLWWIGDYSDQNTGANAGFVAIKMFNALNTGGFQIQSTDKGKGQFAFEFTGHYSMDAQDTVPYEVYVKQGIAFITPAVNAEDPVVDVLGKLVSELQDDVEVGNGKITGTVHYVEDYTGFSGEPELQEGNFLALKFTTDDWTKYNSVKVGLVPSAIGMDLVEIINDPDKNGVFRVTSKTQKLKIIAENEEETKTMLYSLAGLTLEEKE